MKFLLVLLLVSSLVKSEDMDLQTIYSKLSLDSKYKASLVYDNKKEWYALAIYKVQNLNNELINISRVNQSYINNIKLIFTNNSKYLIYVTKANNQYSVYDLLKKTTVDCGIELNLKNIDLTCYKSRIEE